MIVLLGLGSTLSFSQDRSSSPELSYSPAAEDFRDATGIITTIGEASCWEWEQELIRLNPGCETLFHEKTVKHGASPVYNIYDNDGSLWLSLVQHRSIGDTFRLTKEIGFEPFRVGLYAWSALRLTGESENWYRVEVNEETRQLKYVLKNNNTWEMVSWEFFILKTRQVWACSPVKLLDRPEGEVIKEIVFNDPNPVDFHVSEVDGDWLRVRYGEVQDQKFGWIRWRDGHKMLVGNLARPRNYTRISTCNRIMQAN